MTKEVLYKKEKQQSRFYRNRAHSNSSFTSLKRFRKVHVHHAYLINDDYKFIYDYKLTNNKNII